MRCKVINYGAVFKNYGAVCTNYVAVFINRVAVCSIPPHLGKFIPASAEVFPRISGSFLAHLRDTACRRAGRGQGLSGLMNNNMSPIATVSHLFVSLHAAGYGCISAQIIHLLKITDDYEKDETMGGGFAAGRRDARHGRLHEE